MRGRGVLGGEGNQQGEGKAGEQGCPGYGELAAQARARLPAWILGLTAAAGEGQGAQLPLTPACDARRASAHTGDGQHTLTPDPSQRPSTLTSSTTKLSSLLSASLP